MNEPAYTVDPDGEVTLELRSANLPFAEWDEEIIKSNPSDSSDSEPSDTDGAQTKEKIDQEKCFRIQVSAKHLMLASPVFKKLLSGGWKENVTFLQKGSVEITAESWDIEALLILLRAMHCQHNRIPRKLSLEMLAKVAVLADYYKCKEVVGVFADIWIKALNGTVPNTYSRELILWLWIAWFFELSDEFRTITSIAMSQSNGCIDNLGLPIPDKVLEPMNHKRQSSIDKIVVKLHKKYKALLSGKEGCSFPCSSIMCGALVKQMQSNALLSPRPVAPFLNLNYTQLVRDVLSFQSPQWVTGYDSNNFHSCRHSTFKSIFGLSESIVGLELDDLQCCIS